MLLLDTIASRRALASANPPRLVRCELLLDVRADGRALLYLGSRPHAKLQDQLKLLREVVPSVVVACPVSREVVVCRMPAASAMRQNVIRVPSTDDVATANVALSARLAKNSRSLRSTEAVLTRSPIRILALLTEATQFNYSTPKVGRVRVVWLLHFVPRVSSVAGEQPRKREPERSEGEREARSAPIACWAQFDAFERLFCLCSSQAPLMIKRQAWLNYCRRIFSIVFPFASSSISLSK